MIKYALFLLLYSLLYHGPYEIKEAKERKREERTEIYSLLNQGNTITREADHQQRNDQMKAFIHLYQQLVTSGSLNTSKEYIESIQNNIDHRFVRYLYVLEETWNERQTYKRKLRDPHRKVVFLPFPFERQPNYSDIFHIVTHFIEPRRQKDDVWMVSNSDIELGEGFHLLHGKVTNRTLLGLSRHNSTRCQSFNQCLDWNGSTDSFIGAGPVDYRIIKNLNFRQNSLGAENVVYFEFQSAGYRLINPCQSIITYHNHCSRERHYSKERIDRGDRGSANAKPTYWKLTDSAAVTELTFRQNLDTWLSMWNF